MQIKDNFKVNENNIPEDHSQEPQMYITKNYFLLPPPLISTKDNHGKTNLFVN